MEAENRLARLPELQANIEQFISDTKSLLTPEQEVIIARRRGIEESSRKPIEPEVIADEAEEAVAEAETEEKN